MKINESDVHSVYIDSDQSMYLYDKNGNDLNGWPENWPEHIKNVQLFLQNKGINLINRTSVYIHEYLKTEQDWLK